MLHAARLASALAVSATLASLTACQPMRMQVDPSLTDDRMSVSGPGFLERGQLTFGEFSAGSIDRSWTSSTSTRILSHERTRSKQSYRFVFAARGVVTDRVACQTVYAETAHDFGTLRVDNGRHGLGCVLTAADGRPRGELVMTERERHRPSGRMIHDGTPIEVIPRMRGENTRWDMLEPVGYELRVDGAVLGAVQTINGGAVWIDRTAPAALQESAAVAAATLLLYESLDS